MTNSPIYRMYKNTACVLIDADKPMLYVSLRKWSKFAFEPQSKDIFNEAEDLPIDESILRYQGWRPGFTQEIKDSIFDIFIQECNKPVDLDDIHWLGFEFTNYDRALAIAPHLVDHILENDYQSK